MGLRCSATGSRCSGSGGSGPRLGAVASASPGSPCSLGGAASRLLKPRLMPLQVAQALALQLQARRVGTVSVL